MKNPAIFKNHIEPPMKMRNQIDAISSIYVAPSTGNFTSGTLLLYGVN
jgi:hypothetical protein